MTINGSHSRGERSLAHALAARRQASAAAQKARRLDDDVVLHLRKPARVLACAAAFAWLVSLWVSWPVLSALALPLFCWTFVQAVGLALCMGARDAAGHDSGVGLMTVAMAAGCRFQLDVLGGGELWVLPLCLMLSLVLGLVQVRLRSYVLCSLTVWLVLLPGAAFAPWPAGQALRGVLVVGGFTLALLLHRGVALARRRRVAAAASLAVLAYQDALTGVANRRGFLEVAKEKLQASGPQGLIALDVDDFKRINDRHGHEVGDRLLHAVGRLLQRLPGEALAGRTGGEEFCVLVPAASPAALLAFAGGVLEAARRVSAQGVGLTLSAGAALVQPGEALEQAMRRADTALGDAKRMGKNRVVLAPEAAG